MVEKRCQGCQVVKPVEAFSKCVRRPDGLNHLCKECKNASYKKWYDGGGAGINADRRRSNLGDYRAYTRKSNRKHVAKRRAYAARYRVENRPLRRQHDHAKRARKRNARQDPPAAMAAWEMICKAAGCEYCDQAADHLEHMTPLSRGGGHIIMNTTGACSSCNLNKHSKIYPDGWSRSVARGVGV